MNREGYESFPGCEHISETIPGDAENENNDQQADEGLDTLNESDEIYQVSTTQAKPEKQVKITEEIRSTSVQDGDKCFVSYKENFNL